MLNWAREGSAASANECRLRNRRLACSIQHSTFTIQHSRFAIPIPSCSRTGSLLEPASPPKHASGTGVASSLTEYPEILRAHAFVLSLTVLVPKIMSEEARQGTSTDGHPRH